VVLTPDLSAANEAFGLCQGAPSRGEDRRTSAYASYRVDAEPSFRRFADAKVDLTSRPMRRSAKG
jgi:hypothetical protein